MTRANNIGIETPSEQVSEKSTISDNSPSGSPHPRRHHLSIQQRSVIFLLYSGIAYLISAYVTTDWIPVGTIAGLWFLSVVGLVAFRLLAAPFFSKPRDALAAAATAAFVLWTADLSASAGTVLLAPFRSVSLALLVGVAVAAFFAILLGTADVSRQPRKAVVARVAYDFSTEFGRGDVVFTPSAVIGALGFPASPLDAVLLVGVWILVAVAQPIERAVLTFNRIRALWARRSAPTTVGLVERIDDPGLVRVVLENPDAWRQDMVLGARLSDGRCVHILPLFSQVQGARVVGTGLFIRSADEIASIEPGSVEQLAAAPDRTSLLSTVSGEDESDLVGIVVENSTIGAIQFEVASNHPLQEGHVVGCRVQGRWVVYQITDARTAEESFARNPRGTVLVTAVQLGIPTPDTGFRRSPWIPTMNAPVFTLQSSSTSRVQGSFGLGFVPGTDVWIRGNFDAMLELHTAVLGATGVGKTELIFDIIRHGLAADAKVACVDFTEEYQARLSDCSPISLGLSPDQIGELASSVEAVETGDFGGAKQKGELNKFIRKIQPAVAEQVRRFLEEENSGLGIFELEDIANTRSTLRATELYLSEIFSWARRNRRARKILIVLEEAHTVVPEMNLFGYDKSDTLAVIGRISQIALQGRKYGVGLTVVSQRTALVSKTILSQCGTVVAFSLVDKTSLEYLQSVFSEQHCQAIPHLPRRTAVVGGPGVVSERPVIVEIPYDESKAEASAALDNPISDLGSP